MAKPFVVALSPSVTMADSTGSFPFSGGSPQLPRKHFCTLEFDPGTKAMEWSSEELAVLDVLRAKYASKPKLLQHLKISNQLEGKTVRDVEFRCKWNDENENSERKKNNQGSFRRKRKDTEDVHAHLERNIKKDASISLNASSDTSVPASVPSHPSDPPSTSDQFLQEVEKLLRENEDIFGQISVNIISNKVVGTEELFFQACNNINALWNKVCRGFCEMSKHIVRVPPPTTKIDGELLNLLFPQRDSSR